MRTTIGFMVALLLSLGSITVAQGAGFDVASVFENTSKYYVVDLTDYEKEPYNVIKVFPSSHLNFASGDFVMAGHYLFRKDRVKEGTIPLSPKAFLDVIARYDPRQEFPPLRCPTRLAVALVLVDSNEKINGVILMGKCYDFINIENSKGEIQRFLFHGDPVDPLIRTFAPGFHYP